jgi:hypothetical protein
MLNRSDTPTNDSNTTTAGSTGAVSLEQANKVVSGIVNSWDGINRANDFVIADTFDQLPEKIKDAAKQQDAEGEVNGVFHKG